MLAYFAELLPVTKMLFTITGKTVQEITRQLFNYWADSDYVSAMCIIDSYLWMTSPKRGLLRFPIRLKMKNSKNFGLESDSLKKGLQSRLSHELSEQTSAK